jgi:hypothetical protein
MEDQIYAEKHTIWIIIFNTYLPGWSILINIEMSNKLLKWNPHLRFLLGAVDFEH